MSRRPLSLTPPSVVAQNLPLRMQRWYHQSALAVPAYRRFWIALVVSNVGSWIQMVAQGWLILALTNSPFYLGLYGLLRSIPALTMTLVGGVLADRVDRRTILLCTQSGAGLAALVLGMLDLTGHIRVWEILAVAFFTALITAFDNPARQAMVPTLVGRDRVASAVGLNSAAWNGAAVIGPSLAGLIVAVVGTGWAFIANAVSYLPVVWAVWLLPRTTAPVRSTAGILATLGEGVRAIRADRRYIGLLSTLALATLLGRPYLQLMPVFARDVLRLDAAGYGVLMAVNGVGALTGAVLVGAFGSQTGKGRWFFLTTAGFGIALFAFCLSRWYLLSAAVLLIVGVCQTMMMGLCNTLLQITTTDALRGRVMSVYTLIPMGVMPLGTMLLSSLAEIAEVRLVVGGAALAVVCTVLVSWRYFHEVVQTA